MPMIICTTCKQEMKCHRTGVTVTWNDTHRRASDEYICRCGALVCVANDDSYYSTDPVDTAKHLDMTGG